MPHGERIAEYLLSIEAVKFSLEPPFTWTTGIVSPIYCDNRMIYGHPEARSFVVDALVQRVKTLHIEPDAIAGTATAAIGWAALIADRLALPFAYVRSKPKEHGAKKRIEGGLASDIDVVLIEDLISTGSSAISSVQALREEGDCRVADIVSIFSYGLSSSLEAAKENRVRLHPLTTLDSIISVALKMGLLSSEQVAIVQSFARDPKRWNEERAS